MGHTFRAGPVRVGRVNKLHSGVILLQHAIIGSISEMRHKRIVKLNDK